MYQPHNALLAMEVMRGLFGENGHPHLWKEALEAVRWRGRMEEVLPGVYVDGAHNISAVKAFAETVEKTVNERGISSRTMRTAKSRIGDRLVTEKDGTAWVCYLRD